MTILYTSIYSKELKSVYNEFDMTYGKCECGGEIVEKRICYIRRINGKPYEFQNVPVGICRDCGERIFKGKILEKLEELARDNRNIIKEISLSVAEFH